jgi:hypothetical protein
MPSLKKLKNIKSSNLSLVLEKKSLLEKFIICHLKIDQSQEEQYSIIMEIKCVQVFIQSGLGSLMFYEFECG